MADKEYNEPSDVQDFYLYDPLVREFAEKLSGHLDSIVLGQSLGFSSPSSQLSAFGEDSNISSDGGVATQDVDASLQSYLLNNAAFAHALYDEVTRHYELREEGYWSESGLIEVLSDHLEKSDVKYPYEASYREYLTAQYNPGWSPNGDDDPVDIYLRESLEKDSETLKSLDRELKTFIRKHELETPPVETIREIQGSDRWDPDERETKVFEADARHIVPSDVDASEYEHAEQILLESDSIDLILTSPPYWKKRQYFTDEDQIDEDDVELGQEDDVNDYVEHLVDALDHWKTFLRPTGSLFLNIGDTFRKKSLQGVPGLFAQEAQKRGWTIRNEIIWAKTNGTPSPVGDRLVGRHEQIFHLVLDDDYFYDREGYIDIYDTGSNPDDVWRMGHDRNTGGHLAPFPRELVHRAITLGCPPAVCESCGTPHRRITNKDKDQLVSEHNPEDLVEHLIKYEYYKLNPRRMQAQRAIKRYVESDLTFEHLRAVQATGISDAGKALEFQEGAGQNIASIQDLAEEAKDVLKGYFREFTFPQRQTVRWSTCECDDPSPAPGRILDPFAGSGTTLSVAKELGYDAFGVDLDTSHSEHLNED